MNISKMVLLGLLVAMRSMTASATVVDYLAKHPTYRRNDAIGRIISDPTIALLTKAMAGGEMLLDKMPFMPSRTDFVPLIGRMGVAGMLAARLAKPNERILAIVTASVSAAIGSYVARDMRVRVAQQLNGNHIAPGLAEDALVVGGSLLWRDVFLDEV
ncbi:MAG: hypothetical protein H7Y11_09835 [Armatimonadetes bacterium]|nr:hypothetical protein [Anaerolineae bacterium]